MTYDSFMQSLEHDAGCDRSDSDGCLECIEPQAKCPVCQSWSEYCLVHMDQRPINKIRTPMCDACCIAWDRSDDKAEFLKSKGILVMLPPGM